MKRMTLVCSAWLLCAWVCGADAAPPPAELKQLLASLEAEQFETREAAYKKILECGKAALPAVKEALASGKRGPEFEQKARRLVALLDDEGVEVNGLRISLAADRKSIALSGSITLAITLTNTTEKEKTLYLGNCYNPFEKGTVLRLLHGTAGSAESAEQWKEPQWSAEICWAAMAYRKTAIPARSALKFETVVSYEKFGETACLRVGKSRHLAFTSIAPGRYGLSVFYEFDPAKSKDVKDAGEAWAGAACSNVLEIEIKGDTPKP